MSAGPGRRNVNRADLCRIFGTHDRRPDGTCRDCRTTPHPLEPDCRRDEEWGPWLRRVAYDQRLENIA